MTRDVATLSSRPRRVTDDLYRGLDPARALGGWIERAEAFNDLPPVAQASSLRWQVGDLPHKELPAPMVPAVSAASVPATHVVQSDRIIQ